MRVNDGKYEAIACGDERSRRKIVMGGKQLLLFSSLCLKAFSCVLLERRLKVNQRELVDSYWGDTKEESRSK